MTDPPASEIEPAEHVIQRVIASLPPAREASVGEDQDRRARAVLNLLFERAFELGTEVTEPLESLLACPNCGREQHSIRAPYCGQRCRDEASFIRQLRRLLIKNEIFDEEKQATQGQILWYLLGGGYPRRNALVTGRPLEKLFARGGGKCESCGAVAVTFDHIGSACNRPINLRLMCDACAVTKPFGDDRILGDRAAQEVLRSFALRVASANALRLSDDPDSWNWREFLNRRSASAANRPENPQSPPVDHRE